MEDYISTFARFDRWVSQRIAASDAISFDVNILRRWFDSATAPAEFERIIRLIGRMEFKRRQTCPGTKISKVAFGIGRRIPIVEKWS